MNKRTIKDRTVKVEIDMPVFAVRIKQHRVAAGMQQKDLAEKLGLSRVQISNIETGNTATTISTILNMCDLFGVTPNDLLL